jgi:predicted dehydrogenase
MDEARALVELADEKGLRLSVAPSNALSPTVRTMEKAVREGRVGDVRMVYAEFDDNPVYLLSPETWVSRSGAPWPYLHEYEIGCTFEHVGYHLTWMCRLFGPVRSVTAFSKHTLPDKTDKALDPPDTPDFSVAVLDFESGVVGRVTCSIAAPTDHRMRIIGNRGVLETDTYQDYTGTVFLEAIPSRALKARNLRVVRRSSLLRRLFGVGGRPLALEETAAERAARRQDIGARGSLRARLRRWLNTQRGQEDKCVGIAELIDAIETDRPHFPPHDFTLHLTELTHLIQRSGPDGASHRPTTSFAPLL